MKGRKLTAEELRIAEEQRLRAATIPDRRKQQSRDACRKPVDPDDR